MLSNLWIMKIILMMKKMRNIKKLLVFIKKRIHLKFLCLKYYLRKKCIANCIAFCKMPVLKIEKTQAFQGIWKNLVRFRPSAPIWRGLAKFFANPWFLRLCVGSIDFKHPIWRYSLLFACRPCSACFCIGSCNFATCSDKILLSTNSLNGNFSFLSNFVLMSGIATWHR